MTQKRSEEKPVYLEVYLRYDFPHISVGVIRTALPLTGFFSYTWPIITATIISIAMREIALIIITDISHFEC